MSVSTTSIANDNESANKRESNESDQSIKSESLYRSSSSECESGFYDSPFKSGQNISSVDAFKEMEKTMEDFANNNFNKAFKHCEQWSEMNFIVANHLSFYYFIRALLTLEPDDIQQALEKLRKGEKLINKERKTYTIIENLQSLVGAVNFNHYTDDEAIAELCYAENQVMTGLLVAFAGQNIVSMVKAAFNMRASNEGYRTCDHILKGKTNWNLDELRLEFKQGTAQGIGTSNLILSHLPKFILKLLSLVGFHGDFEIAQSRLLEALEHDGLRTFITMFIVVTYNLYMGQIIGVGQGDLKWAGQLIEQVTPKYPNSGILLFLTARLEKLKGNTDKALQLYTQSIASQSEWKQIHNICHWDMVWTYALLQDWEKAAYFSEKLKTECSWGPSMFAYHCAVFRFMQMQESGDQSHKASIDKHLRDVPLLRRRYAGKTWPPEKLAVVRAEECQKNVNGITFISVCELLYIWNILTTETNVDVLNKILSKISESSKKIEAESEEDNIARLKLFKGVCLRNLGKFEEAINCFRDILDRAQRLPKKSYAEAYAKLEIGLTYVRTLDLESAKHWLEQARDKHNKYLVEAVVHLRVHSALQLIAKLEKNDSVTHM